MNRIILLLALAGVCIADNVERVRQNYDDRLNSKIVQQINYELQASYFYQAYSHYFSRADVALPGIAKWFEAASQEERNHANGLITYINKRGGSVSLSGIGLKGACNEVSDMLHRTVSVGGDRTQACICSFMTHLKEKSTSGTCGQRSAWKNALMAFEDTLVLERFVNNELLNLHSDAASDPHFAHILEHDYLDEQVTAIKQIADYVRQLERVGEGLGEYMFDKQLQ